MNPECTRCGEVLEIDADGDPYSEEGLCYYCYHEEYQFTCCACEEYGHVDDQHNFCVVFDGEAGVPPGLYRIVTTPYYWDAIIDSGLFPHALERLSTLPLRWPAYKNITGQTIYRELNLENPDVYAVGHLCYDCQKAILKPLRHLLNHIGNPKEKMP